MLEKILDWIGTQSLASYLGIYGAIVSSILGYLKLKESKRSIKVFLYQTDVTGRADLVIVNTGYRPITILDTFIEVESLVSDIIEPLPGGHLHEENFSKPEPSALPKTLKDGESLTIRLVDRVLTYPTIYITIFDAEGNRYEEFTKFNRDSMFGLY